MKTQITRIAFALIISAASIYLTACTKDSNAVSVSQSTADAAKATTFTSNQKLPFNSTIAVPCANGGAGENVDLTGDIHILIHTTLNGNNFTTKYHFQPQGVSGIGETTGDKYQASGVSQEEIKGSFKNGKYIDTYINNFKLVAPGKGNNYLVHVNVHITVNANGETTANVDNLNVDCK